MGRFSGHAFFGTARRALAPPCLSTRTRSDRHFPDFAGACTRGGLSGGAFGSSSVGLLVCKLR